MQMVIPSLVKSGSAVRMTFQLHAHTYTSSVKFHYNTTKTQTTTTIIFVSQYILQLLGCSGWGGGGQPQISKSVVLHTKDYGISMGVLSSFFHSPPTSSTRLFFGARLLRPRGSQRSHFLFFITGTCCLFVCFIIGRLRSGIFSFITGILYSCGLICVLFTIGSVTAYTSGPSSTCGKKIKFFENLKLFKKPQPIFK